MDEYKINRYVEAIKFAAGSLQYRNISIKMTFLDSVNQLYNYYEKSKDKEYLEVASLHIQAYMEMGFLYEDGSDIFNKVLIELGTSREIRFPKRFYSSKKIKLNKSQIKSMIKKWPASPYQKMKINEVVMDIINKVAAQEMGIYYYKCAVTDDLYELVISKNETFFHDIGRGIFYTFVEISK